jgi:hypothetical protein
MTMPNSPGRHCRMCTRTFSQRERPNSRRRACNFADQISVLVGPSEQLFFVHKHIICTKSRFFTAACSEHWIGGKEKVRLPHVNASLFQCYLTWAYGGQVDVTGFTDVDLEDLLGGEALLVAKLIELYILGDVLDDLHLRNRVIRILVLETTSLPRPSSLKRVWENTPDSSPIRRMLVRRATLLTTRPSLTKQLTSCPEGFVQHSLLRYCNSSQAKIKDALRRNSLRTSRQPRRPQTSTHPKWRRAKVHLDFAVAVNQLLGNCE